MARSITDIQTQITTTLVANMAAIGITIDTTTWSATNLMRLMCYVVAFCINVLEQLFDVYRAEVDTALAEQTAHKLRWYANTAKAFQYGFALDADTDVYDNTGYSDDQVTASKIIAYAAVVEQTDDFGHIFLRIKVAAIVGSDLASLTDEQLTPFNTYLQRVKDAGVKVVGTSGTPDSIKQAWRIYYDPLILNGDGTRRDGTNSTPVQDAIKGYLSALDFNGVYSVQKQIDAVQAVQGVDDLDLDSCQVSYGSLAFANVDTFYTPDAGYLRFAADGDLQIQFIPYNG